MKTATANQVNGVNVDQLLQTIDAIKSEPEMAKFQFKSKTKWIKGAHCRTEIKELYGANSEDKSRTKPFVLEGDEPPVLLGENNGPNAVEAILHALASCLSVGFIYNAAARGINVKSLEFTTEGNLDLHAFLGLSQNKRPGYENIIIRYKVDANSSKEELDELCNYVQKTSPVLDIIRNPVPVKVEMV
ncbi:MAG: OsmC family protein [Cytophagaceae bacterium]